MFGENEWAFHIAEELLEMFELEEILEMNDLTPEDALGYLIENGYVVQPERFFHHEEIDEC